MNKAHLKAVISLLLTAFLFSQCTKIDTTSVGAGLIPGVDNIHTFDTTISIIASNVDDVSGCDSISRRDLLALGIIDNNPLFGSSRAEMYFELKPASFPVTLPTHDTLTMEVDSVVLILKYNHTYGDTNVLQKAKAYRLGGSLKYDSAYKTCNKLPFFEDLLGETSYTPASLKDSIHAFKEDDNKQLRIRLPNDFGTDFIANASKLTSDSAFKLFFPGFVVMPDDATGGQAINYFDLSAEASRVAIYTRSKRDTITDTSAISLKFTTVSAQANFVQNKRNGSEITQYAGTAPEGDSLIFIQSYPGGSYAKLRIPGLQDFPNSVVNRAEIIVEQEYDPAVANFYAPVFLFLDIKDSAGNYIPIPCDFSQGELQSGFQYLGGIRKMVKNAAGQNVARYTFNVSRYVQSILTRREGNPEIRLRAPFYIENRKAYMDRCGQPVNAFSYAANALIDGGVKLSGTNQQPSRMKLHMVYSKL